MSQELASLKRSLPWLSSPGLLQEIQELGDPQAIAPDTVLIDIGQYIREIPLFLGGAVKIIREDEEGRELFLYHVIGGETCAMSLSCCTGQGQSQIKAVTEEETQLIMVPLGLHESWLNKYPDWKQFVMLTYNHRFEELLATIDQIAFHKMDERLLAYLEEKSQIRQSRELSVTHQQIAQELGSLREVISRLLKKLERDGRVKLGRNKIELIP